MNAPVFATLGCRLNAYETEAMKELSEAAGVRNAVIVNTCAVTAEAVRKAKQDIRRLRRDHPDAMLIVTGCAAQTEPETFAAMPEVTRVIGNTEKMQGSTWAALQAPDLIGETLRVQVDDIMAVRETAGHLIDGFGRHRAYVQVQNGCDHRCTFCIIPYGRGNSRSVPIGEIVKEVEGLVAAGFKEVVITGVDITDYGKDLPGQPTLGAMLKRLLKLVLDLPRLRLSSIDVAEIDADILDLIANEPRLMPHLHISMQAGDDLILKRMKRRHLRQDILDFCVQARRLRPDVVFGADIITGFPTETDALFQNTYDCVEEAHISWLHVFPYSEREGTPAAKIPNQVPPKERKARAARLRQLGDKIVGKTLQKFVGTQQEIIIEQDGITGYNPHYAMVKLDKPQEVGSTITAQILTAREGKLISCV
jgi:threonylcarbamoyladenosine tRNA methylthiotransferase MtaB